MASPAVARSLIAKRRSARIALKTQVGISGEDQAKSSFSILAKASSLNKHGAAIQMHRELLVGTTVLLRNKGGTQISARVVAQVTAAQGVHTYGLEFIEQDARSANFWGITFPSKF